MKIEFERVTPKIAEDMLAMNGQNRHLREGLVRKYAADMAAGYWLQDGSPIRFAPSGLLLDGQHRLAAVVLSGCVVEFLVMRGVNPGSQVVMDRGASRSLGDHLKLSGESDAVALAAIIRTHFLLITEGAPVQRRTSPSDMQLLHHFGTDKEGFRSAALVASRARKGTRGLSASMAGTAWMEFRNLDLEDANEFFRLLGTDAGHGETSPLLHLRRRLASPLTGTAVQAQRVEQYALIVKAWNKWRDGEPVSLLYFRPGGAHPETLPTPH